jgi:DNA-binding transcriptional ArsR family regulator
VRCPKCGWGLTPGGACPRPGCGYLTDGARRLYRLSGRGRRSRGQQPSHPATGHRQTVTSLEAGRGISNEAATWQRRRILTALEEHGPRLTRDALSELTGVKPSTMTWRVKELIEAGQVIELTTTARTRSGASARELQLASVPLETQQETLL